MENLISKLKTKIIHADNKKWPFPGIGKDSRLKIDIQIKNIEILKQRDLSSFKKKDKSNRIERIKYAINLIGSKMKKLSDIDPKPDVVIISIPKEILKSCRSKKYKHTNRIYLLKRQFHPGFKDFKDGYNFHNIIKIIGMDQGIPTQLIYPNTLTPNPKIKGRQDLATIAWNLTVALLYKANEIPWKYFEFPENTCFIGISFHKEFDDNDETVMRASVAQTFLSNGRDIVLRGDKFDWDEKISRQPHMSEEYTIRLMNKILEKYKEHWGRNPDRVVIHKTSQYWEDEEKGFEKALENVEVRDLVTVSRTDLRLYRLEQQPVVRGTFVELLGRYYLYNVGYIPCLEEYPGSRVPTPVEIKFHKIEQSRKKICEEIMALARLNWNNIDYSTKYPVTLTFSRNIGEILSEYRAKSLSKVPDKYRYYM